MRSHRQLFVVSLVGAFIAVCIAARIRAATVEWFTGDGSFSTATNWSPGVVPGSTDTVLFALPNNYTISFTTAPFITAITQTDGFVSLNLGTRTLTATSTTLNTMGVAGQTSSLDVYSGTFKLGNLSMSPVFGSTSNLYLDIGSTTTIGTGAFEVGVAGTGNLLVFNGATLITTGTSALGVNTNSVGAVTVTGAGSAWTANQTLRVGSSGTGTLNIQSGGAVTAPALEVGENLGSVGTVSLSGNLSSFTTNGTANIGGSTTSATANSATLNIGAGSTMTLSGTTNLRTNARINMLGGRLNLGAVNVTTGALVNWNSGTINFASAATIIPALLDTLLSNTHILGTNRTLSASAGTFTLGTPLSVTGGNIAVPTLDVNSNLSVGPFSNVLAATTITLEAGTTTEISDFGYFGGATSVTNNGGTLLLDGPLAIVNGPMINTAGFILGTGRFSAGLNNGAAGTVRVETGNDLVIDTVGPTNAGTIELGGGTIEYSKALSNLSGATISGRGVFRGSTSTPGSTGLNNAGVLSFSAGLTDIYGDVNNNAGGQVIAGGASTVTFFDDVVNNGTEIRTVTGSRTVFFGAVSGAGPFTGGGITEFDGDLKPGNSPANVTFGGSVVMGAAAGTDIELAGTTKGSLYDSLTVAGNVTLDGTLNVLLIDGFIPAAGQSFTILSAAGGITGTFSTVNLPTLAGGLHFDVAYTPNAINLSVIGALLGDYNHNGAVDAGDYIVWINSLGQSGVGLPADGNANGTIDSGDLSIWRANFGKTAGSAAGGAIVGASVPEPASMLLAASLLSLCAIRSRRL